MRYIRNIAVVFAFVAAGQIWASPPEEGQTFVTGAYQWTLFDTARPIDNDDGFFAALGYQFNENWAVEGSYARTNTELFLRVKQVDTFSVNALRFFDTGSRFKPYVTLGVGQFDPDENEQQANGGLGFFFELAPQFSFRADARAIYSFDRGDNAETQLFAGFTYSFGGKKAAPPPPPPAPAPVAPPPPPEPPRDSDGDGVTDDKDQCPDTERGALVDAVGCYVELTEPVTIDLTLQFDTNLYAVRPDQETKIQRVVDFMRQYPTANAVIEGHTDSVGSDAYNQKLSERRAGAVRDYLEQRAGIKSSRLSSIGYGEARPKASNDTEDGRAANRRVSAVISGEKTVRQQRQ